MVAIFRPTTVANIEWISINWIAWSTELDRNHNIAQGRLPILPRSILRLAGVVVTVATAHSAEAQRTINPLEFLVGSHCIDGSLPLLASCSETSKQKADDKIMWRRHDWPPPDGYQIEDAFIAKSGQPELVWSYPPFGPFVAANGDGGELYRIDQNGLVTITATQDGSKPYLQHFVGAACGGTGWLVFSAMTPTGSWASRVALLADSSSATACSQLDKAYTRWRLENVSIPFVIQGRARTIPISTVISEHYDGPTIAQSRHVERSFFGRGFGRLVWEAWGTFPPKIGDLKERCPMTSFSVAPAVGWLLEDCRYATNLVAADGTMSGEKLAWPN